MLICLNDLFACSGLTQTRKLLTNFSKNSFYLLPEPLRLGEFLTNYYMYIIWLKIQRYEKISEETKERNKILIKEAWLFPERIDEEDRFWTALRESWLTITGKSWCGLYQQSKDRIEHPVTYLSGYYTWESGKAWKQRDTVVGSVFLLSPPQSKRDGSGGAQNASWNMISQSFSGLLNRL